ncbi:Phosphorus acquisition-controlling protein [Erysiphe neolycopersici]|uniref:Phosphorus acquisition-controlling protein n=1 Tax=Erysiphe neolycopersici TaxID=212602 RepID=A0A420HTY5_9PEZI|nr:Phosphorus acquisition-controlling protein [Erysiphe neolycopersici]
MSFLTSVNPQEPWQDHEPKLSKSFQTRHFQPIALNTDEICFNFQGNAQQQPEDMRNSQEDGQVISSEADNNVQDSGSFMQPFMTTVSNISNSGELNVVSSSEDCGSLSKEDSSEFNINFPFMSQTRHDQANDSIAKKMVMPPTPNSCNIHGINSLGYTQSDYQQLHSVDDRMPIYDNDHEIEFTPLVSPAVSPLEYQFNTLGYSFAEAYLSPLSSPALQAQNDYSPFYDQQSSWVTNSPVLTHECFSKNELPTSRAQNFNDKISKMPSLNSFRVKKSPIVNQNRAMKGHNSFSQSLDEMDFSYLPTSNFESNAYVSLPLGETQDTCSNSSNNLSSLASNPYPRHDSVKASPNLNVEISNSLSSSIGSNIPATPASLMKIGHLSMHTPKLEPTRTHDLSSTNSREVSLTPLSSHDAKSNIEAGLNPGSNIIESESSPMQPPVKEQGKMVSKCRSPKGEYSGTITASLRKSQFGIRSSKKRNSFLNLASPALLPRLSPNIKPLINSGGRELEDSASLILAHKSNYQNILDGTYLPGITYSSELSANLTSKRTSHKIAEQGRRNRMNSALQEIASLLPRDQNKNVLCENNKNSDIASSERSGKGISQSTNSKARTVERAISYINYLKSQLEIANEKLEQIESKNKS